MKKRKFGWKLSRGAGARRALYRSLIRALVEHGSITTTKVKAKAIKRDVEKIINIAKKDSVATRRKIYARLGNDRKTTDKIFKVVAPKFSARKGGYTKTINLPRRKGDYAEMVRFEWTEAMTEKTQKTSIKSKKKRSLSKTKKPMVTKTRNKKETSKGRLKKLRSRIGRKYTKEEKSKI
jgi:large subunit ribosomal protein L17